MGLIIHRRGSGGAAPTISNAATDELNTPDVTSYTVASAANKLMYAFAQETGAANTSATWNTSESMTEVTSSPTTNAAATAQTIDSWYLDSPTATTATIAGQSTEPSSVPGSFEIAGAASGTPTILATYTVDETTTSAVLSSVVPANADSLLVALVTNGSGTIISSMTDTLSGTWTVPTNGEDSANSSVLTILSSEAGSTSSRDITATWGSSVTRPTVQLLEFQPA